MPRAGLNADVLTLAAAELADEAGLEQVTLAALAKRFGVAAPSLYSHVRSNADLKERIALLALAELADRAAETVAGRGDRAALAALGGVYREYAAAHPGRYAATRLPLDDATAARSAGPRHVELAHAVLRGYDLSELDRTHAVRLLGATFQGWATLEAAGAFSHSAPASEVSWERVVDGLDALLRSWERSS
jgi:AcrR family transcriptional regulator